MEKRIEVIRYLASEELQERYKSLLDQFAEAKEVAESVPEEITSDSSSAE